MKRQLAYVLAGLVAGVLGCRKADESDLNEKIDKIIAHQEAQDKKLDQILQKAGSAGPARQAPPEPDAKAVYAVPIDNDYPNGPATAKVTIVEAADFA
jgi:protein-disulfide isomerase